MNVPEKLLALTYCMDRGQHEDSAGHLCDLLEYVRTKIKPDIGKPFKDLKAMVAHYGKNPEPVDE